MPELDRAFAEPMTPYGFRLRPVAEVVAALEAAGLMLAEHRKLDQHGPGFHLLVARH